MKKGQIRIRIRDPTIRLTILCLPVADEVFI